MATTLKTISVKLLLRDVRRIPRSNRSEFIRATVSEKLDRLSQPGWRPKTERGRKMLALRRRLFPPVGHGHRGLSRPAKLPLLRSIGGGKHGLYSHIEVAHLQLATNALEIGEAEIRVREVDEVKVLDGRCILGCLR